MTSLWRHSPPKGHATNDGLRGATPAAVVAAAQGWLAAARAAAGPATAIFLCVPFGGFGSVRCSHVFCTMGSVIKTPTYTLASRI
jgi:hypothetical protein